VTRFVRERTEGKTAYAIARDLNSDAAPTAQGARPWSQATVRALLMRESVHYYGHRVRMHTKRRRRPEPCNVSAIHTLVESGDP
jgi:hypothetical protein